MSGADIAADVAAAIREATAEVGAGVALTGVLVRSSGADESTYPPTAGTDTEYPCALMWGRYDARDRDGTNITARDVRAMIAADVAVAPQTGDRLKVGGKVFHVVNVGALQPGGTVIMWDVQARAADG